MAQDETTWLQIIAFVAYWAALLFWPDEYR